MKYKLNNILISIGMILIVTSCFKDNTKEFNIQYPYVKIIVENDTRHITSGDTLNIMVDSIIETDANGVKKAIGINSNEYEYRWSSWEPNGETYNDTLALGRNFNKVVTGSGYKGIVFVARDKFTGLEYYKLFSIYINAGLCDGLYVVDTKDEIHSNFNEIQNMYVSDDCDDEMKVVRNTYKGQTGGEFLGLVNQITVDKKSYDMMGSVINVFTLDNGCYSYDYLFNEIANNSEMFIVKPKSYKIKEIQKGSFYLILQNNEDHLQQAEYDGNLFAYKMITKDGSDYKVGKYRSQNFYESSTYLFDELHNRFLRAKPDTKVLLPLESSENLIDFNNVGPLDALYMGSGYDYFKEDWAPDSYIVTILKSENGSDYYAYIFNAYYGLNDNQKILDLSNCTDINKAVGFATSKLEKILYYAVGNKVYSVSLAGDEVTKSYMAYTTPSIGDEITNIEMWRGRTQGYISNFSNPEGSPLKVLVQNRMLLITTYNKDTKEGKIICEPIKILNNPEYGLEDNPKNQRIFSGFGRVLCIGSYAELYDFD